MSEKPIKPFSQQPEHPAFWDKRFNEGVMPWDCGAIPFEFAEFVITQTHPLNILIPGCGSAYEAGLLVQQGWQVTALDFSPAAIAQAKTVLGAASHCLCCADFFTWQAAQPLDLIYERAFLCAMPRRMWADWGQHVAELLPVGGKLIGYFFVSEQLKGPPFGITPQELAALLQPNFRCLVDQPSHAPLPVFAAGERWQVWERTA